MTSCVQRAASAAPREKSLSETPRSRRGRGCRRGTIEHCSRPRDARVRLGAVADEVAEHQARRCPPRSRRRSPPRGVAFPWMSVRWRPAWCSVYRCRGGFACLLHRRRAGGRGGGDVFLRPKERYPVVHAEPRAYFSAAELERAVEFPHRPAWPYGARTALEPVVWSLPCGSPRPRDERPVLTGAAPPRRSATTTWSALPLRAARGERARTSACSRSPGAAGVDVQAPRSRRLRGARRRAAVFGMRLFGRHGGRPAPRRGRLRDRLHLPWPVVLDPCSTSSRRCRRARPATTCSSSPEGRGRRGRGLRGRRLAPHDRRQRVRNGFGHTKRVVLYDTLLKDSRPPRRGVVAHELGHVATRTFGTACCGRARRAVRHATPWRGAARGLPARTPPRSPPSCSRSRSSPPR